MPFKNFRKYLTSGVIARYMAILAGLVLVVGLALSVFTISQLYNRVDLQKKQSHDLTQLLHDSNAQYEKSVHELVTLKSADQYKINKSLEAEIASIQKTYTHSTKTYENLLDLKDSVKKTDKIDTLFVNALKLLSNRNYVSAEAELTKVDSGIDTEMAKVTASFTIPENVVANNAPPGAGARVQKVTTPVGDYLVDIIAADLGSTRVIVDTASSETCADNCPVMSLGAFASRSGAFAGINGPYFCPAAYPSCAGKTNSFDTLMMNKDKTYFNSDNNIYSSVPAVIFTGSSARFVGASSQWGRDTSVDSVIAAQPMLMSGGNRVYGGDGEPKREGKGSRSFIGATGSTVYIGVVHNASVAEVAYVLQTLGISDALNLDSGGSVALWSGGKYLAGPGRDTPFGILFVRK